VSPERARPACILVVEDEEEIRRLIERLLRDAGYEVRATGDPQEALWLARSEQPALVISDVTMPVLDGYALLRALQQNPETAHLPVLFLTARRDFSDRVRAFRFGAVDFVTKPFSRDGLLKRVARALAGKGRAPGRVVRAGPGAADELLREAQLDARSGVLSATGEEGVAHVVLQAGEVVQRTGTLPAGGEAEFQELDARREQILTHEARAAAAAASAPLPEFDDLPTALRTVLIAEDDDLFREFLGRLLSERGFTVYPARDGEEALRLVLEHRPWLILTDVSMPNVDGIELCRRVRQHSLVRHTPLVFVSGWDDYKERYRGLSAGADEFVSKSTPVRELLIRVQLVLRRYVELGRRGHEDRGMAGELDVVGAPGLLQMCQLGRLSGTLSVRAAAGRFEARFRGGELVGAECGEHRGAEAVFHFLAWSEGHFAFAPGEPSGGEPLAETLEQILLEGCRRLDEHQRNASE